MTEKTIKGILLGSIFGLFGYFIFKDISAAVALGAVMFMSMFIKGNNK